MPNARLYLLVGCFFLGVGFSELFSAGFFLSLFFLLAGVVLLLTSFLSGLSRSILVISLCLLSFGAGACRVVLAQNPNELLLLEVGKSEYFKLEIAGDIDKREFSDRALANIISIGGKDLEQKERVLLVLPRDNGSGYKDILLVSGKLLEPEPFLGTGGALFDYAWYLKKDRVNFLLKVEKVISKEKYENLSILKRLYSFKSLLLLKIGEIMPYPESGLLSGILLGEKGALSAELRLHLTSSGLIHIAVLSGYNVAVIAALVLFLFGSFRPSVRFPLAVISILILILMTGADPSGVRAGIMGFLFLLGGYLGRVSDAGRLLFIAGFLMLLLNPFLLLHDPGFQLSFLATAGLIFLTPLIQAVFSRFYPRLPASASGLIATTLGAQTFVTPLLLYQTGVFSLYSLPANLLVLPVVPAAMFLGAGAVFLSLVSNIFAAPVAYLAYAFLYYSESVARFAAGLPSSTLMWSVSLLAVFTAYALLFAGVYFLNRFFVLSPSSLPKRSS